MTVSLSIFQQLCPACASSIPVNAQRCDCGHDLTATGQTPLEATLRDEELYESYLTARAQQAHETAQAAARALYEEPENEALVTTATLTREVAAAIEADLIEQRAKVKNLRSMVPPVSLASIEVTIAQPVATPQLSPAKTAPGNMASPAVKRPVPPIPVRPEQAKWRSAVETLATAVSAPVAARPSRISITQTTVREKATHALSALKQAKARETGQRQAAQKPPVTVAQPVAVPRQPAVPQSPPTSFLEEQALRAERVVQERVASDSKECPNCTSGVALNTARCRCGYAFITTDTDLPSLTLCTGDFTALRNTFMQQQRGRN